MLAKIFFVSLMLFSTFAIMTVTAGTTGDPCVTDADCNEGLACDLTNGLCVISPDIEGGVFK